MRLFCLYSLTNLVGRYLLLVKEYFSLISKELQILFFWHVFWHVSNMFCKMPIIFSSIPNTHFQINQTSRMELFTKAGNNFQALTWHLLINTILSLTVECTPLYMLSPFTNKYIENWTWKSNPTTLWVINLGLQKFRLISNY